MFQSLDISNWIVFVLHIWEKTSFFCLKSIHHDEERFFSKIKVFERTLKMPSGYIEVLIEFFFCSSLLTNNFDKSETKNLFTIKLFLNKCKNEKFKNQFSFNHAKLDFFLYHWKIMRKYNLIIRRIKKKKKTWLRLWIIAGAQRGQIFFLIL